jgi:hypothetical protein
MTSAAFNIVELFTGYRWSGNTRTYTLLNEPTFYDQRSDFVALSESQRGAVRAIFNELQTYINARFVEVTQDNAAVRLEILQSPSEIHLLSRGSHKLTLQYKVQAETSG